MNTQKMLFAALHILELPQKDASFFLKSHDYSELEKALGRFKKLVKDQRKRLVRKYHPDLPAVKSDEKMKQINDAVDFVMGLKILRAPIVPLNRATEMHFSFSMNVNMDTATTSSTFFYYY